MLTKLKRFSNSEPKFWTVAGASYNLIKDRAKSKTSLFIAGLVASVIT